jgi:low molecular weight protein-tyrosine phosphatase
MASVLVVCTGNICRSPLAVGFLTAALASRFGPGAPTVSSAGTYGWSGSEAMPEAMKAALERGVDISDHRARRLTAGDVLDADLVLGAAAEHRDRVFEDVPGAAVKAFTLKELVRLLEALPTAAGSGEPGELLIRRVSEAHSLRSSGFVGNPNDEDVADPMGLPLEAFRAIAWELEVWCSRLVEGLYGRIPARAMSETEEG